MTYEIAYAQFLPKGLITIEFEIDGVLDIICIDASIADFDKFCPNEEGKLMDDSGRFIARFDQYLNLHWLMEDFENNVLYRVVNCNQIIDELIRRKCT